MPTIEELLPHRDRMLLLQRIVKVQTGHCIAQTQVSEQWPLVESGETPSLLIVELIAQTAGLAVGVEFYDEEEPQGGMLVGIKNAEFFEPVLTVGEQLTVTVEQVGGRGTYAVYKGQVNTESKCVGVAELQVMRTSTESNN